MVYHEPDQMEFVEAGYLRPLDDIVPWDKVQPWAREAWTIKGHAYGIPYSWYTNEIFYNKKLMADLGVTLPANGQVNQADFLGILKKARAANMEPMVIGVGDRQFPGAYLTFEMLLRKLGPGDYQKLLDGKLSYADARVVSVLRYAKEIIDAGALPKAFATLVQKNRNKAEVNVRAKGGGIVVVEETLDMMDSLNRAFDNLEKKVKKERDKWREKKRLGGRERKALAPAVEAAEPERRVIRAGHFSLKPMFLEEALVQIVIKNKEVFLFRREGSEDWAVLYRRKDGHMLVEPE